jgi:hypothetical protein
LVKINIYILFNVKKVAQNLDDCNKKILHVHKQTLGENSPQLVTLSLTLYPPELENKQSPVTV